MSRFKPTIGVVPLWDKERSSIWMLPGYLEGISRAGGIPLVLPLHAGQQELRQLAGALDGFLLTGGQDVAPERYGATPLPSCGETCPERDALEWALLDLVLKLEKPVFGICRGAQLLNAYLGGTLYQHIPDQLERAVLHRQAPPRDRPVHEVRVVPGTLLHRVLDCDELSVNSYHHQGVCKLAPGLVASAHASDSLVEAVGLPGRRFVLAVQWHPELMTGQEHSDRLFAAFVGACTAN